MNAKPSWKAKSANGNGTAANDRLRGGPLRRSRALPIVGGLLSIAVGLFLALIVFFGVAFLHRGKEGGYCSPDGAIGRFESDGSTGKTFAYFDEGWSGLPPKDHCGVYLVDGPPGRGGYLFVTDENDPPTAAELVHRDPDARLVKQGSYPDGGDYFWILVALLLPPALWGIAVSLRGARATR